MNERHRVTIQISEAENEFLESAVQKKDYLSKSEIVRDGIRAIMHRKEKATA